jgi:hypothetical protein
MTIRRVLIGLLMVLALPFAGNATAEGKKKQTEQDAAQARAELQGAVMRFSDHFASRLVEGFSEVEQQELPTDIWRIVFEDLLFATQAAYIIAVDPAPSVSVLDLVVLVSLGRIAYEDDRIPKYGEQVAPMGLAFQSLETEVWALATMLLTPPQQADLRAMIEAWRKGNPEFRSSSFALVRFGDFAGFKPDSSLSKATRSGVFGMKQAVREVDKIRDLAERGLFVVTRMPLLSQAYVELVYAQAMSKPEIRNLMDNVDQLTEVMAQVPDLLTSEREVVMADLIENATTLTRETVDETWNRVSVERKSAVEQIFDRFAVERQLTMDMVLSTEEPVRGVLSDVNQTVTAANELTNSVNTLAARFVPERPPGWQPEPSEPLDLEQVQATLASLTGILEQADGIVRSVEVLMVSPHWEERLPQFLQMVNGMEAEAEEFTNRSFLQAVALMAIFFALLLAYRFVSHRLIAARGRG